MWSRLPSRTVAVRERDLDREDLPAQTPATAPRKLAPIEFETINQAVHAASNYQPQVNRSDCSPPRMSVEVGSVIR